MDRINGERTIDIGSGRRGFRKKDASAGIKGTELAPLWFNSVQEELMTVIEAAGLTGDPDDWTQLLQAIRKLSGHNIQVFASSDTFTAPRDGWYWVENYGAGGGAGSVSGHSVGEGGGGGGYSGKWVYLTEGTTVPVTVGLAGTNNTTGASGTQGGTTSFGSHCSATGGGPGNSTGGPGAGGMGYGGDINLAGQNGSSGNTAYQDYVGRGGDAAGPFGGKGALGSDGPPATWPGGGGSLGATTSSTSAGLAANGGVIVRW